MIYLLLLLATQTFSSCSSSPTDSDSGPYGRIETYAGTGEAGKGPDDAALRKANFYLPLDLTFGPTRHIFRLTPRADCCSLPGTIQ